MCALFAGELGGLLGLLLGASVITLMEFFDMVVCQLIKKAIASYKKWKFGELKQTESMDTLSNKF